MKIKILFRYLPLIIIMILIIIDHVSAQVAQAWVQRYNHNVNDFANSLAVDASGNVYVTGGSWNGPTSAWSDYATTSYNSSGGQAWVARYNGSGDSTDIAYAIAVDGSGNVYVTGQSRGTGSGYDIATIKYNSSGGEAWVKRYNGPGNSNDVGSSIAVDDSGNVYVTGNSFGTGSLDYATIKYNSLGVQQWASRYNGPGNGQDWARSIAVDGSGNVYVTGNSGGTTFDYATVKYNLSGTQQWIARYDGPGSGVDIARSIAVDGAGNVYVTGSSFGSGTNTDYATIKYNSSGGQQWVQRYNGPGNAGDVSASLAIDGSGNVYVTGNSYGSGTNDDYATIKYNFSGTQQWVSRYNGPANNSDLAQSIAVDDLGYVFVTGYSWGSGTNNDYATVKYSDTGGQMWIIRYIGPDNGLDNAFSIGLDDIGNVYVTGSSAGSGTNLSDYATIKYIQGGSVYKPAPFEKWISGETNTIKWVDQGWPTVNIKCTFNFETPQETKYTIAQGHLITNPEYTWEIPDTLLSFRSKIFVENAADTTQKIESGVFRLKPYVLTRVKNDSTYYDYKKAVDQWGFSNDSSDVWPRAWWTRFNYQGIDPFTGISYSQIVGDSTFAKSRSHYHPDWVSWVNAFTVDACYYDTTYGIYKPTAVLKWRAIFKNWGGSCFGIAAANALAFQFKEQFKIKYPDFPEFINPISVVSSNEVIKVINELFAHQYGNPTQRKRQGYNPTPTQTLNDIKNMLKKDNVPIMTLSFWDNPPGSGGHNLLAYGLSYVSVQSYNYWIDVYDNAIPYSTNPILIDTAHTGGIGFWFTNNWATWGGNKLIQLEELSEVYLGNAYLPLRSGNYKSPFILSDSTLEINNTYNASIQIKDNLGNITGFINNLVMDGIPGSYPLIVTNGSETPPYGYSLLTNNYSVVMNNFTADTVDAFFFTGNKSFMYERYGATQTQTDRLFFDGGVSVSNSDAQTKPVRLLNIINETTQEKLCVVRSLELVQNDSVKIENPDSNKIKLISYGSAKDYDIELNYFFENGWGRFGDFNIPLVTNTSHIFVPNWTELSNNELMVLVDIGNDGTIDDTLYLQNQLSGIGDDQGSMLTPGSYYLAQNYPNPFNSSSVIKYSIPQRSNVTIKVYDILGKEVATLVNEEKAVGSYEINFNASWLTSGVYFYRLQAGSFTETKKMVLMK